MNGSGSKAPAEFEELVDLIKRFALKNGGHQPTLIVESSKTPKITEFQNMPATHDERAFMLFSLGMKMAAMDEIGDLIAVWFITEGWMSKIQKGEQIAKLPSQDPDRVEVLSAIRAEVDGGNLKSRGVIFEMIRNEQGSLIDLKGIGDYPSSSPMTMESPLLLAFFEGLWQGEVQKHARRN
jgi:hypothetical protein